MFLIPDMGYRLPSASIHGSYRIHEAMMIGKLEVNCQICIDCHFSMRMKIVVIVDMQRMDF